MHDSSYKNVPIAGDSKYLVRLASTTGDIEAIFRLRHEVFVRELGGGRESPEGRENDDHDGRCEHLLVIERETGRTVGTYRMKAMEGVDGTSEFYSNTEFTLESLPIEVLANGIEIGRACIAAEHRNTRAIFLLWRALARRMTETGKRYFFGCCSIFTQNPADGEAAYRRIEKDGFIHDRFRVEPRRPINADGNQEDDAGRTKLPGLFEMYLRVGARVCGRPTYDADFGTVDFFIVFDLQAMEPKYRRMFLE